MNALSSHPLLAPLRRGIASIRSMTATALAWLLQDSHKQRAHAWGEDVRTAFTAHPAEVQETYGQHLLFTFTMGMRLVYVALVLMLHGLLPFLCTRTASREVEHVYGVMKARIPKARRDALDADTSDDDVGL